jgi:hypothetical protein
MEAEQIRSYLRRAGWIPNKHGYFCKELSMKTPEGAKKRMLRVKFKKTCITIEMHSSVNSFWFRIGGAPFEVVRIDDSGVMHVLTYKFNPNA